MADLAGCAAPRKRRAHQWASGGRSADPSGRLGEVRFVLSADLAGRFSRETRALRAASNSASVIRPSRWRRRSPSKVKSSPAAGASDSVHRRSRSMMTPPTIATTSRAPSQGSMSRSAVVASASRGVPSTSAALLLGPLRGLLLGRGGFGRGGVLLLLLLRLDQRVPLGRGNIGDGRLVENLVEGLVLADLQCDFAETSGAG